MNFTWQRDSHQLIVVRPLCIWRRHTDRRRDVDTYLLMFCRCFVAVLANAEKFLRRMSITREIPMLIVLGTQQSFSCLDK